MAISDSDWLKTPGIATRSIKEIEAVPEANRWRKAVVLGFRGTSSDQRIKENHERHMNNLKERYMEMKGMKEDVKEEVKEDVKEVNKFPSFGTKSTFCDKSGKRVIGSPQSAPVRAYTPSNAQQSDPVKFDSQSTRSSPKKDQSNEFNGFANKQQKGQQNQHHFKKPTAFKGFTLHVPQPVEKPVMPIIRGPMYTEKFEGFAKLKEQQANLITPLHIETDPSKMTPQFATIDPSSLPKIRRWNIDPISKFGFYTGETPMTRISDSSQSSFDCSTPNESQLCTPQASPSFNCPKEAFPVFENEKEAEKHSHEISFDVITDTNAKTASSGCVNPTGKEKIRRYNKEPTAAGKRYLKPLDVVNNSVAHQIQTQIKFDKTRVKRWVARFQSFRPSVDPTSSRRRRYSNTDDSPVGNCPNSDDEEEREKREVEDVGMAGHTFTRMCQWIGDSKWKVEDNGRIAVPKEGSTIIVRVLSSRGRRSIVAPADKFERILEESKQFILFNSPPRLPNDFMRHALVLLEIDSDEIGQKEYRRGWIFDGNEREVQVLLIDERRIVSAPRYRLFLCPDPDVMDLPPLCVAATFHRELMDHEKELLLEMGCSAKCRVMGNSANGLKLHLSRINAEGHSLDIMFCGEECAGACYHHRKK